MCRQAVYACMHASRRECHRRRIINVLDLVIVALLVLQSPRVTIFPVNSLAIEDTLDVSRPTLAGKVSMDRLAINSSSNVPWRTLIVV